MQVFKAAASQQQSRKCGAEASVDIAVFPPEASLEDFHWRVSLATVEDGGLFQRYWGVDRSLALLEGGALAMAVDGAHKSRIEAGPAKLAFNGEASIFGCPLDGPVIDLSVMTRRQYCQHRMDWLEWEGAVAVRHEQGSFGLLFVVEGEVELENGQHLQAHDTLLLDTDAPPYATFKSAGKARCWWVEFLAAQ
jgi:environmental stress-induced protein Ves